MSTALKITIALLFFVGVLLIGGITGLVVAPSVLALIIYGLEVFNIETTFTASYPLYDGIGLIVLFGFFSPVFGLVTGLIGGLAGGMLGSILGRMIGKLWIAIILGLLGAFWGAAILTGLLVYPVYLYLY
jgi:hypothetical protein